VNGGGARIQSSAEDAIFDRMKYGEGVPFPNRVGMEKCRKLSLQVLG